MNPLDHRIIFATPRRLSRVSAWREHIPFGMFLVDLLRPSVLVELGTHWGNSYCAFCQAVDELKLDTRCYAVDTWAGDEHTGGYGSEVLADLRAHHDPLYGSFSRLVQGTFDASREQFSDASIDLLHIDGLHKYNSVKHDFESWQPKLSERGVVVLHDINARERDFGVWKLWEELRAERPYLELLHAHGLGVVAVGDDQPDAFRELLALSPERLAGLRDLFFALGRRLRLQLQLDDTQQKRREGDEILRRTKQELRERQQLVGEAVAALGTIRKEMLQKERALTRAAALQRELHSHEELVAALRRELAERENAERARGSGLWSHEAALRGLRKRIGRL
jgi:O-antigen biosynthesis protein